MGLFTRDIKSLEDLFDHGLKDIYYAENQILEALPKLIEAATNPQLKKGLKDHLAETENQVSRLEQIFEMQEEKPKGTKCPGINGLLKEGDDLTGNIADKNVLDAAIIASAQAVEHYEITRYGALIAWAQQIGRNDFADILDRDLDLEAPPPGLPRGRDRLSPGWGVEVAPPQARRSGRLAGAPSLLRVP